MHEPTTPRTRVVNREVTIKETGEVQTHEFEEPIRPRRAGRSKQRGFMFAWPNALTAAEQIRATDWRILWNMIAIAEWNTGIIRYKLSEIAVATGPNSDIATSAAVKRLIDAEYVIRTGRGRVRLNPLYFWKGDLDERLAVLKELGIEETETV